MQTIPADAIVRIIPNVLNAGGSALDLSGLLLSTSTRVPIGQVQPFSNPLDVADYFGATSDEAVAAAIYFNGFDNSTVKPGSIFFAQYATAKVAAYLRGADVSGLTLAQLQAISGNLTITIDGYVYTTGAPINLSAATSFSNAADLIETALDALAPAGASFTASMSVPPDGIPRLTVTAVASGVIALGSTVHGAGVAAGTFVASQISGATGGIGVYALNQGAVIASEAMTTTGTVPSVSYDSVSGAFIIQSGNVGSGSTISFASSPLANSLSLTQTLGAVISQGSNKSVPGPFMDAVTQQTQDWVSFALLFDPDNSGQNSVKLAFATWVNGKNNRYLFSCWDTDVSPTVTVPATTSLGQLLKAGNFSGTALTWAPGYNKSVFVCGLAASIDFEEENGRTNFKFRSQSGLVADVTDQTTADNLTANGYNYYGTWATANQPFIGYAEGSVSGIFLWLDSYVNEIWLNNALQLALMELLFTVKSIPYNRDGYGLMEAACLDPINAAVNFGAIRAGVTLSAAQAAEINSAAGVKIDDTITNIGWYLQIKDATPQVRAARGTPPAKLWYTDGQSVNFINLTSIAIQ